jgi:hypothetical protein
MDWAGLLKLTHVVLPTLRAAHVAELAALAAIVALMVLKPF